MRALLILVLLLHPPHHKRLMHIDYVRPVSTVV